MSCLCLPRLRVLIAGLLPTASLRVAVPPVMATLAATLGAASATGSTDLRVALRLGLPPLPIPLALVEQVSASATAASQLALGLGIDLLDAGGPSRLALTLRSLHINLPQLLPLPLPLTANLAGAMSLSMALSTMASVRASLGIDLLAPGAALALKLALAPTLALSPPSPIQLRLMLRLSAYAKLAAAARAFGGFGRLMPALELLARIELPRFSLNVGPLATLSLLLGLRANIQALLHIDPLDANLQLRLSAALRPLWALPSLSLSASAAMGATWTPPGASFALDAQAIAGLGLGAISRLQLPHLAPFSLVASLAAAGGLASPDCCAQC
jgi:hypothetical protein